MEEKSNWFQQFEQELEKALKNPLIADKLQSYFLTRALLTAKKLEKCSKTCETCEKMKLKYLDYIIHLQALVDFVLLHPNYKHKINSLMRKNLYPVHKHLKKVHHYKGVWDNRINYIALTSVLAIILFIVGQFVEGFSWHFLLSLALIGLGWFVGYTLDKRNEKKGWVI
ncbi:MAG TPA: hypothetical protein DCS93_28045 [Microscillaceae bacterium]|nr:hypothetical protein [Microscillaceae bacterium]